MPTTRRDFLATLSSLALLRPRLRLDSRALRVYFVGNSVTDTIRYPALADLARARGHELTWGRHMIPGAPLQWIWDHPTDGFQQVPFGYYPKALAEFAWDVLSLQPFDRQLVGDESADLPTARRFLDLALKRSPDLEVLIYSRWPRRDESAPDNYLPLEYAAKWLRPYNEGAWDGTNETRDYFERLLARLRDAYPERSIRLVPVGDVLLALDEAMRRGGVPGLTSIDRLYQDGIHLNAVGSYVVGCTFWATLFRESPVGLPHEPYDVDDEPLALAIQQVVWNVLQAHPHAGLAKVER